jgi:hypothetical protein
MKRARWVALLPLLFASALLAAEPLEIVSAKWGSPGKEEDVTAAVRAKVKDHKLDFTVKAADFPSDGKGGTKLLVVVYKINGGAAVTKRFKDNEAISIAGIVKDDITKLAGQDQLAELRKTQPAGLLIIEARWGLDTRWVLVTDKVRAAVKKDAIDLVAKNLGPDPIPQTPKELHVTYHDGKNFKSSVIKEGDHFTYNAVAATADPKVITIIEATWGKNNQLRDVSDQVKKWIDGDSLTVPLSRATFKDTGDPEWHVLRIRYALGGEIKFVECANPKTLQIGPRVTSMLVPKSGVVLAQDYLADAKKKYGSNLTIIDAQYGERNRWLDVTEALQRRVKENIVSTMVNDDWGDPARGSAKELRVTFWTGTEVKSLVAPQNQMLEIRGNRPAALDKLVQPPAFAGEGKLIAHNLAAPGKYELVSGPTGLTLSSTGQIAWTPGADQIGPNECKYKITLEDMTFTNSFSVEVIEKQIAQDKTADQLAASMQIDLASAASYAIGNSRKSALVHLGDTLLITAADGITIDKTVKFEKSYMQVAERPDYYIGLSKDPKTLDIIDKTTLKVVRKVKLTYNSVLQFAIHPTLPATYVTVQEAARDGIQYHVVIVDENNGDVREPENVLGTYVLIDPAGRFLCTGYKDIFQKGTRYWTNGDGRIWDTPEYGNIDVLLIYSLNAEGRVTTLRAQKENAGGNGYGIRLSPDGKRITYLSHVGYPQFTKNIPAWDTSDFEKKPVSYEMKGKGEPFKMNYHPQLPLVVVPVKNNVIFFGRDDGDEDTTRGGIPQSVAANLTVEDAYFSPDGLSAIAQCKRDGKFFLYRVPLKLSDAEKEAIQKFKPPTVPQAPVAPPKLTPGVQGA